MYTTCWRFLTWLCITRKQQDDFQANLDPSAQSNHGNHAYIGFHLTFLLSHPFDSVLVLSCDDYLLLVRNYMYLMFCDDSTNLAECVWTKIRSTKCFL